MRVVATGGFRGRHVKVVWSDEALMEGPRDVLLALNSVALDCCGQPIDFPGEETIEYDHLRTHYGFVFLVNQVVGSRVDPISLEWPDGLPSAY